MSGRQKRKWRKSHVEREQRKSCLDSLTERGAGNVEYVQERGMGGGARKKWKGVNEVKDTIL